MQDSSQDASPGCVSTGNLKDATPQFPAQKRSPPVSGLAEEATASLEPRVPSPEEAALSIPGPKEADVPPILFQSTTSSSMARKKNQKKQTAPAHPYVQLPAHIGTWPRGWPRPVA